MVCGVELGDGRVPVAEPVCGAARNLHLAARRCAQNYKGKVHAGGGGVRADQLVRGVLSLDWAGAENLAEEICIVQAEEEGSGSLCACTCGIAGVSRGEICVDQAQPDSASDPQPRPMLLRPHPRHVE